MANTTIYLNGPKGPIPMDAIDNGDGTYSIAVIAPVTAAVDTELPAAAALTEDMANPTTPQIGANLLVFNGATWDRVRVASKQADLSALTITTIQTAYTPTNGKRFRLLGGSISVSAAMSVLFEDNAAANGIIHRTPQLLANTPYPFVVLGGQGKLSAVANNVLKITGSAAGTVTGELALGEE